MNVELKQCDSFGHLGCDILHDDAIYEQANFFKPATIETDSAETHIMLCVDLIL